MQFATTLAGTRAIFLSLSISLLYPRSILVNFENMIELPSRGIDAEDPAKHSKPDYL